MTINTMEEIVVQARDMDDIRQVLAAVLNFCQATDLANAQMNMADVRYRPLTNELAHVKQRVDGYMGDYALRRMDSVGWAAEDEEALGATDDTDLELPEPQEGAEGLAEASEEDAETGEDELPAMLPLGTVSRGSRGARRLSKEELTDDAG